MPLYMKMSQNINKTTRHLKFCYISILTNLLRTQRRFVRIEIYIYIYIYIYIPTLSPSLHPLLFSFCFPSPLFYSTLFKVFQTVPSTLTQTTPLLS